MSAAFGLSHAGPMRTELAEAERRGLSEDERVLLWRTEALERVGFAPHVATVLASRRDVDLHAALELVSNGCSHTTAVRILL